jgi:hypothetical protein
MKQAVLVAAVGLGLGLAVTACGKKDDAGSGSANGGTAPGAAAAQPAGAKGVCNKVTVAGKCNEESGDPEADKMGCELTHGTWTVGGTCPAEKLFGNCAYGTTKIFYYQGTQPADALLPMGEELAKTDCELVSGKYVAVAAPQPATTAVAAAPKAATGGPKGAAPAPAPAPKKAGPKGK